MKRVNFESIVDSNKYLTGSRVKKDKIEKAIEAVIAKVDYHLDRFTHRYPSPCSTGLKYEDLENIEWTSSFWTGMLWLAYEYTKDEKYKDVAMIQVDSFYKRIEEKSYVDTHDLGFLYTLSCVAAYKLTGSEKAKKAAIMAADYLVTRYHEKARIIQAWGNMEDEGEKGRMIIDCNMNLPLLYWASEVTDDSKYKEVAVNHVNQAKKYIVRDDASTFHTYFMDTTTGEALYGKTHQGYRDDSCWARGQAWGIYGFPLSYTEENKDSELIDLSVKLTNYFLNRLPEDYICYWDLFFDGSKEEDQPRDSSSAAIAVCGILENFKFMEGENPNKEYYDDAVHSMIDNLIDRYASKDVTEDGILHHSVYSYHQGNGVDEFCIWGDYFYFEALMRMDRKWNPYWR